MKDYYEGDVGSESLLEVLSCAQNSSASVILQAEITIDAIEDSKPLLS
jgi:hypothetical protein